MLLKLLVFRISSDSLVYVQLGIVDKLMMLIYMDDLIITENNIHKYIVDLLQDTIMIQTKSTTTPLDCKLKLDYLGEAIDFLCYYQKCCYIFWGSK
jgi:hypothetical protein